MFHIPTSMKPNNNNNNNNNNTPTLLVLEVQDAP